MVIGALLTLPAGIVTVVIEAPSRVPPIIVAVTVKSVGGTLSDFDDKFKIPYLEVDSALV